MRNLRWTYLMLPGVVAITLLIGCLLDTWPGDLQLTSQFKTDSGLQVIQDWNRHALLAERHAEGFRVPVVARMYAYLGIAAFETAAWKKSHTQSFNGLPAEWTKPSLPDSILLPVALNACYAAMMQHFFLNAPHVVQHDRTLIQSKWQKHFENPNDQALIESSIKWGEEVAKAVFTWSATDSLGHLSHLHNYDRSYVIPDGPGNWQPSADEPMPPLLPYWGQVRTFTTSVSEYPVQPKIPYSETKGSAYYTQVYELYALSSPLSYENKWIAEFWSDDHPGLTFSPAGRWISIALQVVDQSNPSVTTALETYLKIGIALSDAAVLCWHGKYQYLTERPEAFIRRVIDPNWVPLHAAPPFPGYPSGHSAMGAAVAEVLTDIYGRNYKMTDRSHKGREEFKSDPRSFSSFYEMARENAFSRLVLGVHIRSDCEEGLRLGGLIGKKVAEIPIADPLAGSL